MGDSRPGKGKELRRIPPPVEVDEDTLSVDILDQAENDSDLEPIGEAEKTPVKDRLAETKESTSETESESEREYGTEEDKNTSSEEEDVQDKDYDLREDYFDHDADSESGPDREIPLPPKLSMKREREAERATTDPSSLGEAEHDEGEENGRNPKRLRR